MASPTQRPVTILEVYRVTPSSDSSQLSLPLTCFDTPWLKYNPVERIFFYQLSDPTPTDFNSVILPQLKCSLCLSLTLTHFLPLAGKLKWPAHDPNPAILYEPNDADSLTIAESTDPDSFHHLYGNKFCKATESRPYVPELHVTDSEAAAIAVQITFFPNHGLSIAVNTHHAILDGKSSTLFLKAWAHMNKQLYTNSSSTATLPPELTPFLDRSIFQGPEELYLEFLNHWVNVKLPGSNGPKSLKLFPRHELDSNLVRATFQFSLDDVRKLREMVLSKLGIKGNNVKDHKSIHLSTFVVTFSWSLACLVKAQGMEDSTKICFAYSADSRARLDPPIPETYLGNCVAGCTAVLEAGAIKGEDGVAVVAERACKCIKLLGEISIYEVLKDNLSIMRDSELKMIGVAGSPRFEVYKTDFGWGRPRKVEVTSVDRTGAISMAERRDGSGGVEIGLVLRNDEMEVFDSLFVGGLKEL